MDYQAFHYADTATQALQQLDDTYAAWLADVKSLDESAPAGRGAGEGLFTDYPVAALVLYLNHKALAPRSPAS